jgi:hypothetical protein
LVVLKGIASEASTAFQDFQGPRTDRCFPSYCPELSSKRRQGTSFHPACLPLLLHSFCGRRTGVWRCSSLDSAARHFQRRGFLLCCNPGQSRLVKWRHEQPNSSQHRQDFLLPEYLGLSLGGERAARHRQGRQHLQLHPHGHLLKPRCWLWPAERDFLLVSHTTNPLTKIPTMLEAPNFPRQSMGVSNRCKQ